MSSADDLRRLAEEMVGTYEERVGFLSDIRQKTTDIKKDAADLLSEFGKAHSAMSKDLKAELAKLISDMKLTEKERKKDTAALMSEFGKEHRAMSKDLKAELAGFKSDLESAEAERQKAGHEEGDQRKSEATQRSIDIENFLKDSDSARREMADQLRAELAKLNDERKAETQEMAGAWKKLLSAMQAARGSAVVAGPAKIEAEVTVKTVKKAIEEPVEKEEEVEEFATEVEEEEAIEEVAADEEEEEEVEEDMGGRILDLLEDRDEGLKMPQIADILGIENWRSLIPVIRGLLDDEEIRKEGTLYFLSE